MHASPGSENAAKSYRGGRTNGPSSLNNIDLATLCSSNWVSVIANNINKYWYRKYSKGFNPECKVETAPTKFQLIRIIAKPNNFSETNNLATIYHG